MFFKYLFAFFIVSSFRSCLSFNIDIDANRIKFTIDPSSRFNDTSTFFGYSIGFFGVSSTARLVIGAPRFNNRNGTVFRCLVNGNDHTCSRLVMNDPTGTNVGDQGSAGELLGISISTTKTSISSCAQLHRVNSWSECVKGSAFCQQDRNFFVGRCPVLDENLTFQYSSIPCFSDQLRPYNSRYGMCMLGMSQHSFHVANDDKLHQFFTTPGSGNYAGAVVATSNGNKTSRFINKIVQVDDKSTFNTKGTERAALLGYSSAKGNFTGDEVPGLATGSPRQNKFKGEVVVYRYVINQPSTPPTNKDSTLSVLSTIESPINSKGGPPFFGAAIAAIDINGDSFDDLVVGAPLFSTTVGNRIGQDEGRAFVFINDRTGNFKYAVNMTLEGANQEKARFASTIVNIGDINDDGFDDIAIGAPWGGPDGNGVVYIYNVRNGKLTNEPSQILNSPEQSANFGFSISAAKVDTRVYPVLAVGAPKSGRVFLFKAKTIITLKDELWTDKTLIATDVSNCHFKGVEYQCIDFSPRLQDISTNAPLKFDVEVTIKADVDHTGVASRAFVRDIKTDSLVESMSRNVTFNRGELKPYNQTIYLTIDKSTNFEQAVKLSSFYKSADTDNNCKDGPCAILDRFGKTSGSVEVKYLKLCGSDDKCDIDLRIDSAEIKVIKGNSPQADLLLVGSFNNEIKLSAKVSNRAESAYLSKMEIQYHGDFSVLQVLVKTRPVIVEYDGENKDGEGQIVKFLIDNPILVDESVDIEVKFILKSLKRPKFDEYPFYLSVNSTGDDFDFTNNNRTVNIAMGIQTCLTLALNQQGDEINQAPLVRYDHTKKPTRNPTSSDDIGPKIEYTILFQNNGRVPIENASIEVTIVDRVQTQSVAFINELTLDGINCDLGKIRNQTLSNDVTGLKIRPPKLNCNNGNCVKFICSDITALNVNSVKRMKLSLSVYLAALQKFHSDEMIIGIKTYFHGEYGSVTQQQANCDSTMQLSQGFARIQQERKKQDGKEWWPVLLAVVGALIFLAIICVILYRIGFFNRHRPEDDSQPLHGGSHPPEKYQQNETNDSYDSE